MIEDLKSWDILGGWSYIVVLVFLLGYFYYQIWGDRPSGPSPRESGPSRDFVHLNPPVNTAEGWKSDPLRVGKLRYWDGANWTAREGVAAHPDRGPGGDLNPDATEANERNQ